MKNPADDLAVALVRHGYRAVARARERTTGEDDLPATLLGRPCLVLRSEEGVRAFYDESLVRRSGAVPPALKGLLFGRGAVHGLDDAEHSRRKRLLRDVVDDPGTDPVVEDSVSRLADRTSRWARGGPRVFDELMSTYGAAVLAWAGLEPTLEEQRWVPEELARIVDGFGGSVPAYPRAWVARRRTDRWLAARVADVRAGRMRPRDGSALQVLSRAPLPEQVAAVELGNVVRPTVAVAWLGTSAALHLAHLPQWRGSLAAPGGGRHRLAFAQEVRRTTPFVPALAGIARRAATISGHAVAPGDRLVLDVWGVDTDPSRWQAPEVFDPARFVGWSPGAFDLVPQGGGEVSGHRCPGESLTLRLLAGTVGVLARARYRVAGTAGFDLTRMPTLPGDGLRLLADDRPHSEG